MVFSHKIVFIENEAALLCVTMRELLLLRLLLLLLLLFRFIAFGEAVLYAEMFLLGRLQLVAKGQEDAFTLHV